MALGNQTSHITKKTKTVQDRELDNVIRDIDSTYTEIGTINATIGALPATALYTEVTVSSANLQFLDTVSLVAAPGAGSYIAPTKIMLEYNYGGVAYTWDGTGLNAFIIGQGGADMALISNGLITGAADKVSVVNSFIAYNENVDTGDAQNTHEVFSANGALELYYYAGSAPITGTGNILVKVWYEVKTIGTEL
jgi:hypothetical protein